MNCPQCGKLLQAMRNVYEYPRVNGIPTKVKVGTEPKPQHYAPFCTLRCGWKYGKEMYRTRNKHRRVGGRADG